MNGKEFADLALRTESKPKALNFSHGGLVQLLAAGIAIANIMDTAKKTMFYGKPLDVTAYVDQIRNLRSNLQDMEQTAHRAATPDGNPDSHPWHSPNLRIAHGAIGMFGESGELLEAVFKQMTTDKLDLVNVGEETADSDWYKAIIHDESGVSEEECRAKVIAKLKVRYGDKFTNEGALIRDLTAERNALETN